MRYSNKVTQIEEFNEGIQLTNLKDPQEWQRLRQYLSKNSQEMESYVRKGTTPLFGFPTVLYETSQTGVGNLKKALTDHTIPLNQHKHTVPRLLAAVENEIIREEQL